MFETCLTGQIYPKLSALSTTKYTLPFFLYHAVSTCQSLCKFRGGCWGVEKMRCLCELEEWQWLSMPAKESFGEREKEWGGERGSVIKLIACNSIHEVAKTESVPVFCSLPWNHVPSVTHSGPHQLLSVLCLKKKDNVYSRSSGKKWKSYFKGASIIHIHILN